MPALSCLRLCIDIIVQLEAARLCLQLVIKMQKLCGFNSMGTTHTHTIYIWTFYGITLISITKFVYPFVEEEKVVGIKRLKIAEYRHRL